MDAWVRKYIHENLSYRLVTLWEWDGKDANALEAEIKDGSWERGSPFLNPGKSTETTDDQENPGD